MPAGFSRLITKRASPMLPLSAVSHRANTLPLCFASTWEQPRISFAKREIEECARAFCHEYSPGTRTRLHWVEAGAHPVVTLVRNGHLTEREVISGAGRIPVRQPRVCHRDQGRFSSAILPKDMRRVPSVDALIPALTLKGSRREISVKH